MAKKLIRKLENVDLKNATNNEMSDYANDFNQLDSQTQANIITKFPDFIDRLKKAGIEYNLIVKQIINSNNESSNHTFNVLEKEMENLDNSSERFYKIAAKVQEDCSKAISDPNSSPAEKIEILKQENELVEKASKRNSEDQEHQKEIRKDAIKTDSENKRFNWGLLLSVLSVTASILSAGVAVATLKSSNVKIPMNK